MQLFVGELNRPFCKLVVLISMYSKCFVFVYVLTILSSFRCQEQDHTHQPACKSEVQVFPQVYQHVVSLPASQGAS